MRLNKPEIRLEVDRERAADMGVNVDAVARAIESMLGGRKVTRYKRGGEQYDVVVQTTSSGRDTPDDIEKIFVRGRGTDLVPLSSLVKIREVVAPRELNPLWAAAFGHYHCQSLGNLLVGRGADVHG